MSQESQIINHMEKFGPITPMQALKLYKCFRLASRVNDLRNKGHFITTDMIEVRGKRIAKYSLIRQAKAKKRNGNVK